MISPLCKWIVLIHLTIFDHGKRFVCYFMLFQNLTSLQKGVITPFVEAMNSRKLLHSPSQTNDNTFITNSINHTVTAGSKKTLTSETDDTADVVMQKIAHEMGLVSNEELELFEDYAVLPPT